MDFDSPLSLAATKSQVPRSIYRPHGVLAISLEVVDISSCQNSVFPTTIATYQAHNVPSVSPQWAQSGAKKNRSVNFGSNDLIR